MATKRKKPLVWSEIASKMHATEPKGRYKTFFQIMPSVDAHERICPWHLFLVRANVAPRKLYDLIGVHKTLQAAKKSAARWR